MELPKRLFAAFEWTELAGETNELLLAEGDELDKYCTESALNCEAEGDGDPDVNANTLRELHGWLREYVKIQVARGLVEIEDGSGAAVVSFQRSSSKWLSVPPSLKG